MKKSNFNIVIIIMTVVQLLILFSCKKEDAIIKNESISLEQNNSKTHKNATSSYIQNLSESTEINIFEFVTNPYFIDFNNFINNFNDMYIVSINDNNEIVFDNEALQNLRINYNTFIEGISISFPNFILLEDFIQDQVLDATDNLCYTTIIGKKKYDKRIKLLAELKGDNLINDDEFKELFNLATNELNEKNPGLNYPLME